MKKICKQLDTFGDRRARRIALCGAGRQRINGPRTPPPSRRFCAGRTRPGRLLLCWGFECSARTGMPDGTRVREDGKDGARESA